MSRHALSWSALWIFLWIVPAQGQAGPDVAPRHFVLTQESEQGFTRFMELVRSGKLGPDVQEAGIDVAGSDVELELIRKSSPHMMIRLRRRTSDTGFSRHFDLEARENASADDLARVGQLLDEVFTASPFQEVLARNPEGPSARRGEEESTGPRMPRGLESRLVGPASLEYTIGIIVLIGLGLLASIITLCLPAVSAHERKSSEW